MNTKSRNATKRVIVYIFPDLKHQLPGSKGIRSLIYDSWEHGNIYWNKKYLLSLYMLQISYIYIYPSHFMMPYDVGLIMHNTMRTTS